MHLSLRAQDVISAACIMKRRVFIGIEHAEVTITT